jgi:hypothetical protein
MDAASQASPPKGMSDAMLTAVLGARLSEQGMERVIRMLNTTHPDAPPKKHTTYAQAALRSASTVRNGLAVAAACNDAIAAAHTALTCDAELRGTRDEYRAKHAEVMGMGGHMLLFQTVEAEYEHKIGDMERRLVQATEQFVSDWHGLAIAVASTGPVTNTWKGVHVRCVIPTERTLYALLYYGHQLCKEHGGGVNLLLDLHRMVTQALVLAKELCQLGMVTFPKKFWVAPPLHRDQPDIVP